MEVYGAFQIVVTKKYGVRTRQEGKMRGTREGNRL